MGNGLDLAIYCKVTLLMVTSRYLGNELVLDAMYGTYNLEISIFSVHIYVDGIGKALNCLITTYNLFHDCKLMC